MIMKSAFLSLILLFVFGNMIEIQAQTSSPLKFTVKHQKAVTKDDLTIEFVSLIEDSRCPIGVNCIWAGNAKVQIKVSNKKKASKIFELSTNLQPKTIDFECYEIALESLIPHPKADVSTNPNDYTAIFAVRKL